MAQRTREQNLALMTDRHVAVTANAGSGKTRVLVERYLGLITNPDINGNLFEIEEIAAITFTKKAAAEMKAKIIRILNDKIKEYDYDLKKSLFYDDIRDNMIYANISTIHSFCYQILKEYPIEAGLPPNFGELSDFDHSNIINDSIDETLEKYLEKDNKFKNQFLYNLVQVMDYKNLRNNLKTLLSSGESYNNFMKFYADKTINELSQNYNQIIFEYIKKNLINYINNLLDNIESVYVNNPKQIEKIAAAHNRLKENLINIENEKQDIFNLLQYYFEILTAVKEKAGRSYIINQISKNINNNEFIITEKNVKSFVDLFTKYSKETISNIQKEYLKTILLFRDTAIEIHSLIEKSKMKIPAFTFDDILLKTLELLENNNNDIREKIRRKLKYLLVDEFQDTNHVQYNIIKYIIPDFDELPSKYNTNLFIVGDDKQSIYSFRSADVRVFNKIKHDITSINAAKINKSLIDNNTKVEDNQFPLNNSEAEGLIDLSASFRLKPAVASFVNAVCRKIMKSSPFSQYEVQYKPLIFARNSKQFYNNLILNLSNYFNLESNYGSINFFFSIKPHKDEINPIDEYIPETVLIARYIKQLVTGKAKVMIEGDDGIERIPDFKDIAILARKKKGFRELSGVLLKNKIPYIVDAGKGFFEAQEVIDIVSLLKFFRNENNDIALAGALKSPMFGLNDSDLLEISQSKKNVNFWSKFVAYSDVHQDNYLIQRAYQIITNLMKVALYIPISKLIVKIIESTAIIGAVSFENIGKQMKANINQLITFARNFEQKGFKTLHDFVSQIDDMTEFSSESEVNISSNENVVKIMSIHGAKGLEFPIVIILNANSDPKGRNDNFKLDKDLGVSYQYHCDIHNESVYRQVTTPINILINNQLKLAEIAEEKRLLYVAMTRAKDHLAVFSTLSKTQKGEIGSFKGMLANILDPIGIDKTNIIDMINSGVFNFQEYMKILVENEVKEIKVNLPIFFSKNIEDTSLELKELKQLQSISIQKDRINSLFKNEEIKPIIEFELINPEERFEIFSASKLSSFTKDKLNYELNYILGLPSNEDINFEGKYPEIESDNDEIIGTFAGTYIHTALEFINIWFNGKIINDTEFWKTIKKIELNQEVQLPEKLKERIYQECSNIIKTEFIKKNSELIKSAKFEYQLNLPLDEDILTSSIDVLVQDRFGNYEIWDWKSNMLTVGDIENLGEKYNIQMRFYSYIISLLNPHQEIINSRLLFTRLAKEDAKDDEWIYNLSITRNEVLEFETWIKDTTKFTKKYF